MNIYMCVCFSVSLVRFSVRPRYNGVPWRVADVCVRRRNDHRCARERVQLIASGKVVCEKFNRSVDAGSGGGGGRRGGWSEFEMENFAHLFRFFSFLFLFGDTRVLCVTRAK